MDSLLAVMGDWSPIAIYGLMGAIFGGLLALVGGILEKLTGISAFRYAAVLGFALSSVFTREVVMPAVKVAYVNQNLPQKLDEVTVLERFDLSDKTYIYHLGVDQSISPDYDPALIKQSILTSICDTFRPEFTSDALDAVEYRYHRGPDKPKSFFLRPSDCM